MAAKALSPKHKRFVAEYLKDLNATQAYIRAGYSENGAGQSAEKLLKNPEIAAAVAKGQEKLVESAEIDAAQIIKDLQTLSDRAAREGQYSAAIRAKELVGKHSGMFVERREVKVTERMVVEAPHKAKDADDWRAKHAPVTH